jgi:hypothetical protein
MGADDRFSTCLACVLRMQENAPQRPSGPLTEVLSAGIRWDVCRLCGVALSRINRSAESESVCDECADQIGGRADACALLLTEALDDSRRHSQLTAAWADSLVAAGEDPDVLIEYWVESGFFADPDTERWVANLGVDDVVSWISTGVDAVDARRAT